MQSNDSLDSLPQPPVAQSNTFYGSLQDITEILYSKDSQIQTKLSKTSFKKNNSFSSSFTKHFTRYFCCYNSTERCDCNYTLHQDPKDS